MAATRERIGFPERNTPFRMGFIFISVTLTLIFIMGNILINRLAENCPRVTVIVILHEKWEFSQPDKGY